MSSSSTTAGKVSFTVRRPTPASHGGSDSESSTFKVPTLPRHLFGTSTPNSPLGRSTPSRPKSRTYTERDSSDEGSEAEDELVTAFDQFGAQRLRATAGHRSTQLALQVLRFSATSASVLCNAYTVTLATITSVMCGLSHASCACNLRSPLTVPVCGPGLSYCIDARPI
ncbi:hypothetical protein C8T65DRAFT_261473 [Cerioporus squamosus]|nr:hypothetical protein C8T65DRAFT_261473 [Cerioporus squamosus]